MTLADLSSPAAPDTSLALPDAVVQALIAAGQRLEARGMAAATSGNYSAKLPDGRLILTVSGAHKGRLTPADLMPVSATGESLDGRRSSAETLLHTGLYQLYPQVQAILHAHSVISVTLTRLLAGKDTLPLEGYEMLKAFPGVKTHETRVDIPIFDNAQDITQLSAVVNQRLRSLATPPPAYLLRGHGIYTWGASVAEAERVMEAMEHLLACELETLKLKSGALR